MTPDNTDGTPVDTLLSTPGLAEAFESDRFKQFLDNVPVAIAVSAIPGDVLAYANLEFERLGGEPAAAIEGKRWLELQVAKATKDGRLLSDALIADDDYIGAFALDRDGARLVLDAWSNVIEDEAGSPLFRLVVLAQSGERTEQQELEKRLKDTDILLRELQHRVKNNLQMITALIRLESRGIPDNATAERFDRLSGRIESLGLLYRSLLDGPQGDTVDLGTYLSQIATSVMQAHAVEGIRLDLKVDTWPVSIDVAMPTGLVVNELLTNALKHAFTGRSGGTIKLHSLVDGTGCRVTVSDDGNGLAEGDEWPRQGKLGNLIVNSLKQNAKAEVVVKSTPNVGVQVTIFFARADAAR